MASIQQIYSRVAEKFSPFNINVTTVNPGNLNNQQTLKVVKGKATITLGTPGAKVSIVSGTDRREFPTLPIAVDLDTSKAWALEAFPKCSPK